MLDQNTGVFREMDSDQAGILRRIFKAGQREIPIFETGDLITVRGATFRVLGFGGKLLVLEGVAAETTTGPAA